MKKLLTVLLLCSFVAKAEFVIPNLAYTGSAVSKNGVNAAAAPFAPIVFASSYMTNTTANQSIQLQAAMNACAGTSPTDTAVLILPAYNFYTKEVNPKSYTKVVGGTGQWKPYLADGDQSERMFYVSNKTHVSIRNVTFMLGMAPGDLQDGWCPVSFENSSSYVQAINLYIEHDARVGDASAQNNITNTFGYAGIKIASATYGVVTGCFIKNVDANIHLTDDYGTDSEQWQIYNNVCDGGTSEGITIASHVQTTIGIVGINIYGNVVRNKNDSYGILVAGAADYNVYNNLIYDCVYGIGLSTENNVGYLGGVLYQHGNVNGNIYNNRIYSCVDGLKGNASTTNVYGNHFGSMEGSAINTLRAFSTTSNYTAQYFNIYNNTVDSVSLFYPFQQAAIKIYHMSNSKVVNNLFRTRGSEYGIRFYNTSGYGTNNVIKNNIIDNNIWFEVNNFTQANTLTGNRYTVYSGFTPGGTWTVSGQIAGVWSPPTGTTSATLFFYNQTGSSAPFTFSGLYYLTGNVPYTNSITLANEASAILFRSATQPNLEPDPVPGVPLRMRRPVNVQFQ